MSHWKDFSGLLVIIFIRFTKSLPKIMSGAKPDESLLQRRACEEDSSV